MVSTGIIFDIKRFSIHDGPGIRSTVFLKGCPLSCQWCHNPESQSFTPEFLFRVDRCLLCGSCIEVCPEGAIRIDNEKIITDIKKCVVQGQCVSVCYPGAREIIGREVSPSEVVDELVRDRVFYEESGGGVTFSGGEPLSQSEFLEESLKLCHEAELKTALDTCGSAPWEELESQLPYLDLVLYDHKLLDDRLHKKFTGVSNKNILENFVRLGKSGIEVIVRRPVIPGVNDSSEEINRLGVFLQENNGVSKIDLLPYHALSADKYTRLGREQSTAWKTPSPEDQERITTQLNEMGFQTSWGG